MIRGVAFDLEGTIIDVEAAHHLGHLATAKELGLSLSYEEAISKIPAFVGGPDSVIAAEFRRLSRNALPIEAIVTRMREHYHIILETIEIKPREGFVNFLLWLRGQKIPVTIGSVTPAIEAQHLLRAALLLEYFDLATCVFIEAVANPKPAPDVYLATAQRMGITPDKQVVFEDSPRGIMAARAAGAYALAIPTIHTSVFVSQLEQAGAKAIYGGWDDPRLYDFFTEAIA